LSTKQISKFHNEKISIAELVTRLEQLLEGILATILGIDVTPSLSNVKENVQNKDASTLR